MVLPKGGLHVDVLRYVGADVIAREALFHPRFHELLELLFVECDFIRHY
jgi:hypothetical protein